MKRGKNRILGELSVIKTKIPYNIIEILIRLCVCVLVAHPCPIPCIPMDGSPPDSCVHGILQERILECVAIPFFRVSSWPRDQTQISHILDIFFTIWATREAQQKTILYSKWSYGSVQFCHSVVSNSLQPHGLQHTRPPCPSPTPRVYSNLCLLSQWCHPTISSSVIPFSSHLQSFPASGSFPMSQFFASVLEFQHQHQSFQWTFRTDFL